MGLSWQQGPLAPGAVGRFLVPAPLPPRLLYVEPLRRRMRVRCGGAWIADSEAVVLLFEPGRYPVAYFPQSAVAPGVLEPTDHLSQHSDLGPTAWYTVRGGEKSVARGAWQHTGLPAHAGELNSRVAFAWPRMDAFYEEDERILGHAADAYHRIDIRQSSRRLVVSESGRTVADTRRAQVLYESGFAPRWYVPRADIDQAALTPVENYKTFCPYKGICRYYNIGQAHLGAWFYPQAYEEVARVRDLVSFEPDVVTVHLDGVQLHREPGQEVLPHGPDRDLDAHRVAPAP